MLTSTRRLEAALGPLLRHGLARKPVAKTLQLTSCKISCSIAAQLLPRFLPIMCAHSSTLSSYMASKLAVEDGCLFGNLAASLSKSLRKSLPSTAFASQSGRSLHSATNARNSVNCAICIKHRFTHSRTTTRENLNYLNTRTQYTYVTVNSDVEIFKTEWNVHINVEANFHANHHQMISPHIQ